MAYHVNSLETNLNINLGYLKDKFIIEKLAIKC